MPASDEHFYLQAMQEAKGENRQEGLWAKALTLEKGDSEQAKYRYVQLRVEQLSKATEVIESPLVQPATLEPPPSYPDGENILGTETDQAIESAHIEKGAPVYSFVSPPADLTKYTVFALWALVTMSIVAAISDVMQLNLLDSIRTITTEDAESNDTRVFVVEMIHVGVILIASILVLVWKYRANENCRGFGAQGMRFTPGWAVGWNFVPFMNFFRPYQVMQEIWKVSTDPSTWQSQTGGLLVKWWWAAYLISILVGKAFSKAVMKNMFHDESVRQLEQTTSISIVTSCAILVISIMTIWLISAIHEKQKNLTKIRVQGVAT